MIGSEPIYEGVTAEAARERPGPSLAAPGPELAVLPGPATALAPEFVAAFGFAAGWLGRAGAALVTDRFSGDRLDDLVAQALAVWCDPRVISWPIDPPTTSAAAAPAGAGALWVRLRAGAPGAVEIHVWSGSGEHGWRRCPGRARRLDRRGVRARGRVARLRER